jgi:hypothetical protein
VAGDARAGDTATNDHDIEALIRNCPEISLQ